MGHSSLTSQETEARGSGRALGPGLGQIHTLLQPVKDRLSEVEMCLEHTQGEGAKWKPGVRVPTHPTHPPNGLLEGPPGASGAHPHMIPARIAGLGMRASVPRASPQAQRCSWAQGRRIKALPARQPQALPSLPKAVTELHVHLSSPRPLPSSLTLSSWQVSLWTASDLITTTSSLWFCNSLTEVDPCPSMTAFMGCLLRVQHPLPRPL